MKQCARCNRTYADESLLYCLDDGTVLTIAYDPEATQFMPDPRITDAPKPPVTLPYPPTPYPAQSYPPQPRRSRVPIFALIALLLLVLGGGTIALLLLGYSYLQDSSAAVNTNQPSSNQGSQAQNSPSTIYPLQSASSPSPSSEPPASATPESAQLVGTWRANVYEDKENVEITYTFYSNGSSKAIFKTSDGQSQTHYGNWRYSDGTLFETFSDGGSGKATIRWIDHDNCELTIIDNGVPLYSGLKRRYRRISDPGKE